MTDTDTEFPALWVPEPGPAKAVELTLGDLPGYDVLIEVHYSTINYKDALAVTARGPICRRHPMVCGIDLAGVVCSSDSAVWREGQEVVVNGFGLSETEWGGYSGYAAMKPEWLVERPDGLTLEGTMGVGTAGYTAALCVQRLIDHGVAPGDGDVLVTGATGGVGSFALLLLSWLGYRAVAVSGRPQLAGYLQGLGASDVLDRAAFDRTPRPLEREKWAAAVDCVGGGTLATALAQTRYGGIVAACGLAGSAELPSSVMPFILRGVTLAGIDSVMAPLAPRQAAWQLLGSALAERDSAEVYHSATLPEVPELCHALLDNRLHGRTIVDLRR